MQAEEHGAGGAEQGQGDLSEEQRVRVEVEARLRAAIRVLVIDNEVETADRVVSLLERAGYEAEVAVDGASGLSLAERFQPHLILLGPITNSVGSIEYVRALRASSHSAAHPAGDGPGPLASAGYDVPILHLVDRARLLQQRFQVLSSTPLAEAIITPVDERELLDKVARALLARG